jgi:MFS family permease
VKLLDALVPVDFRSTVRGPLRRFYTCTFIACIGNGLTLSLFVIYLHNVRGFSTSFATLLLALSAVVGLASTPLWGTMTDRVGPFPVIMFAYFADAVALVFWAFAHTHEQAILAALLIAVFGGAGWGPMSTMLSRLVSPDHRQRAFGVNFMLVNLGIGFGALISASVVDLRRPDTFVALYIFNAGVTLLASFFYVSIRQHGHPVSGEHHDPDKSAEGWSVVLRDNRMVRYVVGSVFLMVGGYGSLDSGLSLFVVNDLKISVHAIGVIFFFNTTTIVVAQLWVLNRIEGRSRTRVLGVVRRFGSCFGSFWPRPSPCPRSRRFPYCAWPWSSSPSARRCSSRSVRRSSTTLRPSTCGAATTPRPVCPGEFRAPWRRRSPPCTSRSTSATGGHWAPGSPRWSAAS